MAAPRTTKLGMVTHGESPISWGYYSLIPTGMAPAIPKIFGTSYMHTWYEKLQPNFA